MATTHPVSVRDARPEDVSIIVDFNLRLARETEGKALDPDVLRRGVLALINDRALGFYLVAKIESRIVGQTCVTYEWSDWRNGAIWWLQSVYVEEAFRQRGVFRALLAHIWRDVEAHPEVIGLRLYVERDNVTAQRTYERLAFGDSGYLVMERLR